MRRVKPKRPFEASYLKVRPALGSRRVGSERTVKSTGLPVLPGFSAAYAPLAAALTPVYPTTAGLAQHTVRALVQRALAQCDLGDTLPQKVSTTVMGQQITAYPGLLDIGDKVDLTVFRTQAERDAAHRTGVIRLLMLRLPPAAKFVITLLKNP